MDSIDPSTRNHEPISPSSQLSVLQDFLSDTEIETICYQLGHSFRHRQLPPGTLVRSIVYRSLHPDKSVKSTLADLVAGSDSLPVEPTDAAWCQARSRFPLEIWPVLLERSVQRVSKQVGLRYHYHDRPVYKVDGSTVSMPDEPELVEAFGYADTKHGPSRFPVARMTFITQAGAETVVDYQVGPYRTGECTQFHAMWDQLPNRAICLVDRQFSSFYDLAKLQQRQIDVVSQLHQRRCPYQLIHRGKQIGKQEWIVPLTLADQTRKKYDDPTLPEVLFVRLIRVRFYRQGQRRELWLITTLLDAQRYRRSDILQLYRDRWGIETRIGSLKATLKMAVLRSKKLLSLRCELAATILAHNLTWTIIHQAADLTQTPAARISFAGTLKIILTFSTTLRIAGASRRRKVYRRMLRYVAQQKNPYRPKRIEPRLIKRETKHYGFLKISRAEARKNA
jgi:hypothetical protein